jgi:hypothetical protein
MPNGAQPAHLLGAAAIAVAVGNRGAHHLWSGIPAVPRYTPVLAAHQLQTSIPANTIPSVPRCTLVLAARQLQIGIPANTIPSVPRCILVLPAHQLHIDIRASTTPSVPRCTLVLAAHQLQISIRASTTLGLWVHRLQTSIPARAGRLVGRCTPAPASPYPQTAIPAGTPHKAIEVQLVPTKGIAVSVLRDGGPQCRRHNCVCSRS